MVIDPQARMTGAIPEKYRGLDRFACRQRVLDDLREQQLIEREEDYRHNVGHCQRCETVVEPHVSQQWFMKTKELAQPAVAAVEKGEIVFFPDKWKKVYFNWMEHIQDWCISRQLWWGHRIPAYYCRYCQEVIVAEEEPRRCPRCDSTQIEQDSDVLDTWFSSALWPFITLGWQDGSPDYQTLLPHLAHGHRFRHHLFLGGAHDHDGPALLRCRALPRGADQRPDPRRERPEDEQDAQQRH